MDLGLLQQELAEKIGACEQSIVNWERNASRPTAKWIPRIAAFLGYNPPIDGSTLAERLVNYRRGRGWTQKRFAEELEVDQSTLARWEQGMKQPILKTHRKRVAAFLNGDANLAVAQAD